jgi:hypothetical protein
MSSENLLSETLHLLNLHEKLPSDVQWVGAVDFGWFTWRQFERLADCEYDSGYGSSDEIPQDLVVVGEDWWLARGEHDGMKWWEYKSLPPRPGQARVPRSLIVGTLEE